MSGSAFPLRTTPSVAEQEGHLMEMEATGAPQKHQNTKSVSWHHYRRAIWIIVTLLNILYA
jgi:hypothetical protein